MGHIAFTKDGKWGYVSNNQDGIAKAARPKGANAPFGNAKCRGCWAIAGKS